MVWLLTKVLKAASYQYCQGALHRLDISHPIIQLAHCNVVRSWASL